MTYNDQRALVFNQPLFKHFQCFDIQVVGRFVEDQKIGWLSKQLGENNSVTFATGQCLDRRHGPLWAEQKAFQVADDVSVLAIDAYVISAAGYIFRNSFVELQFASQLIEIANCQIRAVFDGALLWRDLAQQNIEQGAFSNTVITDQSNPVATHNFQRHILDQGFVVKTMRHVAHTNHLPT